MLSKRPIHELPRHGFAIYVPLLLVNVVALAFSSKDTFGSDYLWRSAALCGALWLSLAFGGYVWAHIHVWFVSFVAYCEFP